jgi:hypothetical protein
MPTSLGLVFFTFLVVCWLRQRPDLPWQLSLAAPISVVLVVMGNGLEAYHFVALIAAFLLVASRGEREGAALLHGVHHGRRALPGLTPLALFVVWALIITLMGPWVFSSLPVLIPRAGIDQTVSAPLPLRYNISNLAQGAYLILGFATVLFLAQRRRLSPHFLVPGLALAMLLTGANLLFDLLGLPWPSKFFDVDPNTRYVSYTTTGEPRFRGIFAEPSGLATWATVAVVYFISAASRTGGRLRLTYAGLGTLSVVCLWASGSGKAAVAGLLLVALVLLIAAYRFLTSSTKIPIGVVLSGLAALIVVAVEWSRIYGAFYSIIVDKLASQSYFVRTTADLYSLDILVKSFGLGVGLGSNRPSSFWPGLLSTTGIIGAVLFAWATAALILAAWRRAEWRPTVYALLTLLMTKSIAGSDLSSPLLWLGLGGCAYAAWRDRADEGVPSNQASSPVGRATRGDQGRTPPSN